MLKLAGLDDKEWDINYFDIVKYEQSGDHTLLTVNDKLNTQTYRLLVAVSIDGFLFIYNDAKHHVEYLQTITFKVLNDIQQRHKDYFSMSSTSIQEYLFIFWEDPVKVKFTGVKELPIGIKTEIEQKFLIVE
jgi:hypothetical protein